MFVPPQVLNKSLLNNSLNSSRLSITPLNESISESTKEPVQELPHDEPVQEPSQHDETINEPTNVPENNQMDNFIFEDSDSDADEQDVVYQDMQLFFHAIGEFQLIELFLKNKVTLGQLLEFDEQDLINCGVELVGDRKKILANTGQMHCEKWMPSSLQDLTTKSLLSSPGIYVALNDINKHVEYIGVTLKYIRRRLQKKPEILELGKDFVGITKVSSELKDLLSTITSTLNQASALNRQIGKHLSDPNLRPANHIDDRYLSVTRVRRRFVAPVLLITVVICMTLKFKKSFLY